MAYKPYTSTSLSTGKKRTDAEQWGIDRPRIHALKNKVMTVQQGFDDDNYRDLISDVSKGRADSSKDLSPRERLELMDRLSILAGEEQRKAWQPMEKKSYPHRPKNMDRVSSRADQLGKIEALLTVGKKSWAYADAIAKAVCKVDKVAWVEDSDLYKIITALRLQAKRQGWDLSGEKKR